MAYPKLVRAARTPVSLTLTAAEPNEFGERDEVTLTGLRCNWQDRARVAYTADKQKITTTGTALFDGDICPAM